MLKVVHWQSLKGGAMNLKIVVAVFGLGASLISGHCLAQAYQWNPLEGAVTGESGLGATVRGLEPPQQTIPLNSGWVVQPAPVQQPASVLQSNQVYHVSPFSNGGGNYTEQTIQQEVARLRAGGVGGLNQHPVMQTTAVQQPPHVQNYYPPQPTFVQTQRRR